LGHKDDCTNINGHYLVELVTGNFFDASACRSEPPLLTRMLGWETLKAVRVEDITAAGEERHAASA
jgi:hypothetical protein